MSKYTTEVRFICEHLCGLDESKGYNDIGTIISNARQKIFDFEYPIFDDNYKSVLETKILRHYYTREIGQETVGLWKLKLCTKLNDIMPYYNQLYKSAVIEFNPMYDMDLTTDYQKVDNGNRDKTGSFSENGSGTVDTTVSDARKNDHWDYYSDTPQGGIKNITGGNTSQEEATLLKQIIYENIEEYIELDFLDMDKIPSTFFFTLFSDLIYNKGRNFIIDRIKIVNLKNPDAYNRMINGTNF